MSKTVGSIRLGRTLRRLREDAGLAHDAAHTSLGWSRAKLDRIEAGETVPKLADLAEALTLYAADGPTRDHLTRLRAQAKQRGWYHAFADVWNSGYAALEDDASEIFEMQSNLVPGLLQTSDYARAVITAANPKKPPEWIDRAVQARMNRKELLTREAGRAALRCVVNESALKRLVGGPEVMLRQISYLWEMAQRPNITVQILPLAAGAYAAMDNSFIRLTFPPDVELAPVVFAEGLWGAVYLESPADVERFTVAEEAVVNDCLSPEMTVSYLATLGR
jgi:transcriptional regulator with XRE-family HTH domain